MAVETEKCDAVSKAYSRITQSARQAARTFREFRVGEALLPADDRSFPGELLLGIAQEADWCKRNVHDLSSPGGLTAIHDEYVPGDVVRSVGSEKDRRAFQVMFVAKTPRRNMREKQFLVTLDYTIGHVRGKPARRDGVDLNVVQRPLAGQIFGEADDSTFAGVIANRGELGRSAPQPGNGGNVDDFSSTLANHDSPDGLCAEKAARQVRLDDLVPIIKPHLFHASTPGNA